MLLSKQLKTTNMKNTILKVIKQSDYDRIVFINYSNDQVIGLNFHQDVTRIIYDFAPPCPHLTEIFNRLTKCKFSNNNLTIEESINKAISLYVTAFIFQD